MRLFLLNAISFCIPMALLAAEPENLLKPTNSVDSWRFELVEPAAGDAEATEKGVKFTVTEVDGTNWHVQTFQTDLDLKEGQSYTVKFKAMAPVYRSYQLVAGIDEDDWREIGLHEDLTASKTVSEESFTFTATGVAANKNRIGFVLGDEKGSLVIEDMTLTVAK